MMRWRFMGHQSYVVLCTETTLSKHPVIHPKLSCDIHLLRSLWLGGLGLVGLGLAGLWLHGLGLVVLGVAGLGLAGLALTKRRDLPVFGLVDSLLLCSESTQHKTGNFYLATGRLIGLGQGLLKITFWKRLILNSISGTLSKFMRDKTLESMKLSQLPQRYKATACLARRKDRILLISLGYSKFYHSKLDFPLVDLHLIFEFSSLKFWVWWTGFFSKFELDFACFCSLPSWK